MVAAAGVGGGPGRSGGGGGAGMPSPGAPPLELIDVSEEADEAAESFPSGTMGGWMGSGTRVLLPMVPADCVVIFIPFRDNVPVLDS